MTVSGRHFDDDASVYVDGRRVDGSVEVQDDDQEKVLIKLDALPVSGMHTLQVQAESGLFSNDFIFHVTEDSEPPPPPTMGEIVRGGGWEDYSYTKIDSYEEMSLRIAYESDDNWFVEGYVENLTDEFTWDGRNGDDRLVSSGTYIVQITARGAGETLHRMRHRVAVVR